MDRLKGIKTYAVSIGIALVILASQLGYIDDTLRNTILGFLGAGGLAALRAGVDKNGK